MLAVFVYGTLKPGEAAYKRYCEPYVVKAQVAWVQGHLFHLPQGYPALTEGDRWVEGTWLQLRDAAAIAQMDAFEDYIPTRPDTENLYVRRPCDVFSRARRPLGRAWVYRMERQQVLALGGIEVPTGVWSRHQWPSITVVESPVAPES
jgi:gamma-glutamylcyclotransferase (GGCT)/AIG2-like uncharacterized protein YtfP